MIASIFFMAAAGERSRDRADYTTGRRAERPGRASARAIAAAAVPGSARVH
jgi:hypothetical protein